MATHLEAEEPMREAQKPGPVANALLGILALILCVPVLIVLGNVVVFLLGIIAAVSMVVIPLVLIVFAVACAIRTLLKIFGDPTK
jgi:hypothetical protein